MNLANKSKGLVKTSLRWTADGAGAGVFAYLRRIRACQEWGRFSSRQTTGRELLSRIEKRVPKEKIGLLGKAFQCCTEYERQLGAA